VAIDIWIAVYIEKIKNRHLHFNREWGCYCFTCQACYCRNDVYMGISQDR